MIGCCLTCERPHQSREEWLAEKALIATVLNEWDTQRHDGLFRDVKVARAAWGRISRSILTYRKAHGA